MIDRYYKRLQSHARRRRLWLTVNQHGTFLLYAARADGSFVMTFDSLGEVAHELGQMETVRRRQSYQRGQRTAA